MTEERLREIEWAVTYVTTHKRRVGCRCGGSCNECMEWKRQADVLAPSTVLDLVAAVRQLADERSHFARQAAQAVEDAVRAHRALSEARS